MKHLAIAAFAAVTLLGCGPRKEGCHLLDPNCPDSPVPYGQDASGADNVSTASDEGGAGGTSSGSSGGTDGAGASD